MASPKPKVQPVQPAFGVFLGSLSGFPFLVFHRYLYSASLLCMTWDPSSSRCSNRKVKKGALSSKETNTFPGKDHISPTFQRHFWFADFPNFPFFGGIWINPFPGGLNTSKNELSSSTAFPPRHQASKPKAQPVAWGTIRSQEDYTTGCNKGNPFTPVSNQPRNPFLCLHPDISKPMTDPWYWYIDVLLIYH